MPTALANSTAGFCSESAPDPALAPRQAQTPKAGPLTSTLFLYLVFKEPTTRRGSPGCTAGATALPFHPGEKDYKASGWGCQPPLAAEPAAPPLQRRRPYTRSGPSSRIVWAWRAPNRAREGAGLKKQTAHVCDMGRTQRIIPGDDLLSHTLARAVPLALGGLTAVFGMGTGVSPPLQSPENSKL